MIISFDIDNTLIPYSDEFSVKEVSPVLKLLGIESLRIGTVELFEKLNTQGWEIWIYTTSFRSTFNLWKTFRGNGLKPDRFINENINKRHLKKNNCHSSKNPKLFGIDIHVDDSKGVVLEGHNLGFKVIHITPENDNWINDVLIKIEKEYGNIK